MMLGIAEDRFAVHVMKLEQAGALKPTPLTA
jgi:hypothetical protein